MESMRVRARRAKALQRLARLRKTLRRSVMALVAVGLVGLVVFVANDSLQRSQERRVSASNPPSLVTVQLPPAKVGVEYVERILAEDQDVPESLEMVGEGLPEGLVLGRCRAEVVEAWSRVECELRGVLSQEGEYQVGVKVRDYAGNEDVRIYRLTVE